MQRGRIGRPTRRFYSGGSIVSGLVVIGGSYAGIQVALTARENGYSKPVTVIADEGWLPYQRSSLSKDFLLDGATEQKLMMHDHAFFGNQRIELVLRKRAASSPRAFHPLLMKRKTNRSISPPGKSRRQSWRITMGFVMVYAFERRSRGMASRYA